MQRYFQFPLLILIGFLLAFLLTWPFITKIDSFYSDDSDYAFVGWVLWYNQASILNGRIFDQNLYFSSNQFYPQPFSFAYSEHLFIPSLIFAPIYWLSHDLIFSVNYYAILTFVLSFISAYYCINYFIKNKFAIFLGAFIFTFNPVTFAHFFGGHLQLMNKFFLPPLFLFAYQYIKNPIFKNSLLFFLFFTLNALSCIYFQIFSLILIPIFWMPFLLINLAKKNINFFKQLLLTGLVSLIFFPILLYFNLPYLKFSQLEGIERTLGENAYYSARGIDWISSLNSNLFYGEFLKSLDFLRQPKDTNGFFNHTEHILFTNIIPTILLLIGLFYKRAHFFFAFILVLFFSALFTFGPYFFGWAEKNSGSTTLYYYLYQFFPPFHAIRVPTRFQFIFYFPFALLAALGAERLLKYGRKFSLIIFSIVFIFLIFENINKVDFNLRSNILDSLETKNKTQLINLLSGKNTIHLPLFIEGVSRNVGYLNWSTVTGETIFNGYSGYFPSEWGRIAEKVKSLDKQALERLFVLGIDYIVIHKEDNIEILDLKKYKFNFTNCTIRDLKFDFEYSSYPVAQISGTKFQMFSKITLINPKNCYLVNKYQEVYSNIELINKGKKQIIPIKLPILIEPFEKIKII